MASSTEKEITSLIECTICMRVPYENHIYQCSNGHIVCEECRNRTVKTQREQSLESESEMTYVSYGVQYGPRLHFPEKHTCPSCRVYDFNIKIRNILAEKLVKYATFPCDNLGCYMELKKVKKRIDISISL